MQTERTKCAFGIDFTSAAHLAFNARMREARNALAAELAGKAESDDLADLCDGYEGPVGPAAAKRR